MLGEHGVDFVDVSTGGNAPAKITIGPGYQVGAAKAVRAGGLPVSAVGLITDPAQAQQILDSDEVDVIALARVALREPSWPYRAAAETRPGGPAALPAVLPARPLADRLIRGYSAAFTRAIRSRSSASWPVSSAGSLSPNWLK